MDIKGGGQPPSARSRWRRRIPQRAEADAGVTPLLDEVVRIANRANCEAPKSGDSRRIARRSIKSRFAQIVI